MWTIAKYETKKSSFFLKNLKEKLGSDVLIYNPSIKIKKYHKKKIIEKNFNILGDYIFCFSPKLANTQIINQLKFTKGLKYFLDGYKESQKEIINFLKRCKESENNDGSISSQFFDIELNKKYKFNNGPLLNLVFQVISIQKNKFKILLGDKVTTIKKGFLYSPL